MDKSTDYFLTLTDEQVKNEIPLIFQRLMEGKIVKSQELADILLKFPNEITTYVFSILESETSDIEMKAWILEEIVPKLPFFVKIALEELLQKMAQTPTDEERSSGLDKKANIVLNSFI